MPVNYFGLSRRSTGTPREMTATRWPIHKFHALRLSAVDTARVSGLTHQHYKYPARFSPTFARAAIDAFSSPGDLVLDPYMGGGTTVVEALAAAREVVGCDINELAHFVARAKTVSLSDAEIRAVEEWALACSMYRAYDDTEGMEHIFCELRTRNLQLPRARVLKKFIAHALALCELLKSENAMLIARCALLNVSQWALHGRRHQTTLDGFRNKLLERTFDILEATRNFSNHLQSIGRARSSASLILASAANLPRHKLFEGGCRKVDLVVTSPPYPGVHVLYHRWQVDGRRETPAPYWIAGCADGQGSSYYNFGRRGEAGHDQYFQASFETLVGIRGVMREEAVIVQMIAFSDRATQLPRYLENMVRAGFREISPGGATRARRIWRNVPGRSWHAEQKGRTAGSREVVLVHEAV